MAVKSWRELRLIAGDSSWEFRGKPAFFANSICDLLAEPGRGRCLPSQRKDWPPPPAYFCYAATAGCRRRSPRPWAREVARPAGPRRGYPWTGGDRPASLGCSMGDVGPPTEDLSGQKEAKGPRHKGGPARRPGGVVLGISSKRPRASADFKPVSGHVGSSGARLGPSSGPGGSVIGGVKLHSGVRGSCDPGCAWCGLASSKPGP